MSPPRARRRRTSTRPCLHGAGGVPDSFDPRTAFKTPRKDQGDTQLCGESADQAVGRARD